MYKAQARFHLEGDQAHGPGGFTLIFFQQFWKVQREDIVNFVMRISCKWEAFMGNGSFLYCSHSEEG